MLRTAIHCVLQHVNCPCLHFLMQNSDLSKCMPTFTGPMTHTANLTSRIGHAEADSSCCCAARMHADRPSVGRSAIMVGSTAELSLAGLAT